MADTIERLAVLIEANTKSYTNAMAKLQADTTKAINAATKTTSGLSKSLASTGDAAKLSTFQLQNLTYQVNDLAQQLATGQSPFRSILEQGSQIIQLFGPGTGVTGALKQIGPAIFQFLTNPLTLATVGFAVATQAAFGLFDAVTGGGKSTEDVLKETGDYIDRIRDSYKEATGAAIELADASQRQKDIAEGIGNAAELASRLKSELGDISGQLQVILADYGAAHDFGPLLGDMQKLKEQIDAGNGRVLELQKSLLKMAADPTVQGGLRETVSQLLEMVDAASRLQNRLEQTNWLIGIQRGSIAKGTSSALDNGEGAIRFGNADEGRKFPSMSKSSGRSYWDQQAEAIAGVYDNLRQQYEQLTMTDCEQAIANQLAAAHVNAASADGQVDQRGVDAIGGALSDDAQARELADRYWAGDMTDSDILLIVRLVCSQLVPMRLFFLRHRPRTRRVTFLVWRLERECHCRN